MKNTGMLSFFLSTWDSEKIFEIIEFYKSNTIFFLL
jgi:hypothetical protein